MRLTLASLLALSALSIATAAHATTFSLPTGSTATVGGLTYTITGSLTANGSNEITGGSITVDGLPAMGNVTFAYSSDGVYGGGNNMFDLANFGSPTDTTSDTIYYGSLALYTLPVLENGNIVICDGICSSVNDTASETSAINLTFAGSPYSLQGTLGGTLNPATVAATPEPSSLILLGTGLVGVAGATRRRFLKA